MTFAAPHLLWLSLLAPLVGGLAIWFWRRRQAAEAAWTAPGLWPRLLPSQSLLRRRVSSLLLALAVLGTGLALARPRWGATEERVERRGVDVVFILDSSLSMGVFDVPPSRLYVAKTLIRRLVQAMPGNRVALIQAEAEPMVLTPLTTDAAVIDLLLDTVEAGSLPNPGTRLAPALAAAQELFPEGGEKHRVVVVLSDGEDHGGGVEGRLRQIQEARVVLHAIGVGTPEGAPVPLPGQPGGRYKKDAGGRVVISRLEEEVLEQAARQTGGIYLRATSPALDLQPILHRIDAMEKRVLESESVSPLAERFQWPLALAVTVLALQLVLGAHRPAVPGREEP